jgi:hypothetical protein
LSPPPRAAAAEAEADTGAPGPPLWERVSNVSAAAESRRPAEEVRAISARALAMNSSPFLSSHVEDRFFPALRAIGERL